MSTDRYCDHCGAKIVEYKHNFSAALANGLYQLYLARKPMFLTDLELTRYQWTNFQKLRYWNLVEQAKDGITRRATGAWKITHLGMDFIENPNLSVFKNAWTFRGELTRFDGDKVFFKDVHEKFYKQRPQYAMESVPHDMGRLI
jgi:hypothetical protein